MQAVEIYIGTSLKGKQKGTGRVMYIMKTLRKNGTPYESAPEVAEFENASESGLVVRALRDALQRLNYACEVTIYTECISFVAAINQEWPEKWKENGWKGSKGQNVKDAEVWGTILQELEDSGHELGAVCGKHEYIGWMAWQLPIVNALKGVFDKVPKPD